MDYPQFYPEKQLFTYKTFLLNVLSDLHGYNFQEHIDGLGAYVPLKIIRFLTLSTWGG